MPRDKERHFLLVATATSGTPSVATTGLSDDTYGSPVSLTMEVSGESGGFETSLLVAFAVITLLVIAGFAFVAYAAIRGARAARRAGIDPFTHDAQLLAQAISGQGRTVEQRLAELDDLHRRGVISTEEHRTARARALEA